MNEAQLKQMETGQGFIAALDQSGGSTPKALKQYGIDPDSYQTEAEMFDLVHEMRTRIMTSPAFNSDYVIGAILFEMTMDREVEGKDTADYLWEEKGVVPFLKVDKGLADEVEGVQLMKPMPNLDELLQRAVAKRIFGTKMRSFISEANVEGIRKVVAQQFELGKQILAAGLMPIIEPEVDIKSIEKEAAEEILKIEILAQLEQLDDTQRVMLKLTLPTVSNFYKELVDHPQVVRVVALSGGYSRDESCRILAENEGVIASFSRALTEGLSVNQTNEEFDNYLEKSIKMIASASK